MTDEEIVEAVRRMKRTAEMSAEIMRDRQRTGAWEGAEKVARQFDRLAERASDVFTALSSAGRLVGDGDVTMADVHPLLQVDVQAHRDAAYKGGWDDGYAEGYGKAEALASAPHPAPDATAGYAQAIRREAIEATRKKAAEASIRTLLAQTEGK